MKLLTITVALCSILGLSWYVVIPNKGIRFNALSPIATLVIFLFTIYYIRFSLSANTSTNFSSAFTTDLEKTVARYFHSFVVYTQFMGIYIGAALNWRNIRDLLVIIKTSEANLKRLKKNVGKKELKLICSPVYIFALIVFYYFLKFIHLKRNRSCLGWSSHDEKLTRLGSLHAVSHRLLLCL